MVRVPLSPFLASSSSFLFIFLSDFCLRESFFELFLADPLVLLAGYYFFLDLDLWLLDAELFLSFLLEAETDFLADLRADRLLLDL